MMKNDLSTDHDGGIDNMSGNYDVSYWWYIKKIVQINCCIQNIPFLGTESYTVINNIA